MTQAPQQPRQCKLPGCQVRFTPPLGASHKEFCCSTHRFAYHTGERKRAMLLLKEHEVTGGKT